MHGPVSDPSGELQPWQEVRRVFTFPCGKVLRREWSDCSPAGDEQG